MRFAKDITIGEIPTASNSNYSALFQTDGQVRKRTLGSIITQDIDAYLSGISVAFPTSIFNIADSSITPSQPNLVVSLKNQLAGTVFAAPETLNGTPSFRKLSDVDLDQTTVAFQDDIPDVSNFVPYTGATSHVDLNYKRLSNVYALSTVLNSMTYPNATNSSSDAWNQSAKNYFSISSGNNRLAIIGESTQNARKFGLQVGHTLPAYANAPGVLELQPLHGEVRIGSLTGTGNRMVVADSQGILSTQSLPSDNFLRLGDYTTSQDGFPLNGGDVFNLRNTVAWATSSANRPNNTNSAIVAFTPYKSGTSEYGFFLGARSNRLWLSTLENGTPSGWVEIAKRSEFGNYLPLSGGTMTGSINWTTINTGLSYNNTNRLRFTDSITVLSSNQTGTAFGIYLRPQGDNTSVGQVAIGGDGQIDTQNHGNSSQWKQAYDWGNHADAGYITSVAQSSSKGRVYYRASSNLEFTSIPVIDTRSTTNDLGSDGSASYIPLGNNTALDSGLTPLFHYKQGSNQWVSSLIVKGWTGSYTAWKISGTAHSNNAYRGEFYLSDTNISGEWSEDYRIWHSGNIADPATETWVTSQGYSTTDTVTRLRGLTSGTFVSGDITLLAGSNTSISQSGNNITISSTNTTYSAGTLALLTAGTNQTNRVWRADYLNQGIKALTYNPDNLTFGSGLNYNPTTGVLTSNQDSIFAYSPQGGLYTTDWSSTALGQHSVAIGYTSVVTASSSISIGKGVFTGGAMSQNIGFSSNVNKALSANVGSYNLNNGELGNTFGQGLINQGMGTTVIGKYNQVVDHQPNMDVDEKTPAIQFGVGKDELTRRNAVTIFNDRRMDYDAQRDDSTWHQYTIPDIKWIQENISGGGGGGNMNFAYIDPDNTHAFGTDMANGLLVPASYISKPGLTEGVFDLITVRALVGDGYGDIAPHVVFSKIAVSINDDILVTQGCIKTGTNGRASEARDAFNLVLIYYTQNDDFNLSWLNTAEILNLRHKTDYVVNVIGQIFDHNGEDYFNVNPQIV